MSWLHIHYNLFCQGWKLRVCMFKVPRLQYRISHLTDCFHFLN